MWLYEFNYMQFGTINAPATFVTMTRAILHGIKNVATYMGDICIHTKNFNEYIVTLTCFFQVT